MAKKKCNKSVHVKANNRFRPSTHKKYKMVDFTMVVASKK